MLKRLALSTALFSLPFFLAACSDESTQREAAVPDSGETAAASGPVTVYSSRQEHLIKPLFDRFTAETGIEVRYQTGAEGPLIARLEAEGSATFADMFYTVDAGNLWVAAERGLLSPVESDVLEQNIPEHLRDPENRWFGMSVRARTIVYSTERVDPAELSTYADLADPRWEGRLCLRTSKAVYNMSLVATMIARHDTEVTQNMVEGWVENLAAPPFSSDTLMIQAIAAGQCDVGLANSYYLGRLQAQDPDYPVGIFWANQADSGVHVNISGAGVTTHASNREGAVRLLEWLSTEEPQLMFSELNLEFPANPDADLDPVVAAWGDFKPDNINVEAAGRLQREAVMLMDRADYR